VASAALSLVLASSASAEEVFTSQAAAANATDSTWIPAPAQRAAVCIVDTGNDPNPDTSNVVARLSVDGEPGTDRSPDHHGTLMSMIAAAPYNGFGMVGAAPSINVVSVRASRDGVTFGATDLAAGIQQCLTYRNTYNIKVISLSLGGMVVSGLDAGLMATVEDIVSSARLVGLNVVAAAGNHPGAVDWPAGYAPVMTIAAADDAGERCGFSASGREVDLWASGCPLDVAFPDGAAAWASGSSESTAFVAGALTQLRQLTTDLTPDEAERVLTFHARARAAGPSLDVAAGFAAAGLTSQLSVGRAVASQLHLRGDAAVPAALPSSAPSRVPIAAGGMSPAAVPQRATGNRVRQRLPRPSVRLGSLRHGRVSLEFTNKPAGTEALVAIYGRRKGWAFPVLVRRLRVIGDRMRTRVSGAVVELLIVYRDPHEGKGTSVVRRLHPRR
jgi:subtilase family protein